MDASEIEPIQNHDGPAEYLGDGTYVRWTGHEFLITSEDGIRVQNVVALDLPAIGVLHRFANRIVYAGLKNCR